MEIIFNKNRGWRGMASALINTEDESKTIYFTFSPDTWEDLIVNHIFIYTDDETNNFVICTLENHDRLPRPTQQRSVLIKNAVVDISVQYISQYTYTSSYDTIEPSIRRAIKHFTENNNYHTQSIHNDVGVRVSPYDSFML